MISRNRVSVAFLTVGALALTLMLWAACFPRPAVRGPRLTPTAQLARATAIQVICVDQQGHVSQWGGSAVVIGPSTLLTANHVVDCDMGVIAAYGEDGSAVILDVEATAPAYDVARAVVADGSIAWPSAGPVALGPIPSVDDEVCLAPRIPSHIRRCGKVGAVNQYRVEHSVFTEPGNSGGGVWDAEGRLAGIIVTYSRCRGAGGAGQVCGGGFAPLAAIPWVTR